MIIKIISLLIAFTLANPGFNALFISKTLLPFNSNLSKIPHNYEIHPGTDEEFEKRNIRFLRPEEKFKNKRQLMEHKNSNTSQIAYENDLNLNQIAYDKDSSLNQIERNLEQIMHNKNLNQIAYDNNLNQIAGNSNQLMNNKDLNQIAYDRNLNQIAYDSNLNQIARNSNQLMSNKDLNQLMNKNSNQLMNNKNLNQIARNSNQLMNENNLDQIAYDRNLNQLMNYKNSNDFMNDQFDFTENDKRFSSKRPMKWENLPELNIIGEPYDNELEHVYPHASLGKLLGATHPILIRRIIHERVVPHKERINYRSKDFDDIVKGKPLAKQDKKGGVWKVLLFFVFMFIAGFLGFWYGKKSEASNYVRVPSTN